MNDDLHRHLDGEIPVEGLADDARSEAQAWDRLLGAFQVELPHAAAPPWLESKVMAEIEALPEPGLLNRMGRWLVHPRPLRVSPLYAGLATAALALLLFWGGPGVWGPRGGPGETGPGGAAGVPTPGGTPGGPGVLASNPTEGPLIYVQFVLEAPGASTVAVAGDFDGWEGSHVLEDPDGDGMWVGRVPVRPGVHAYMFLVDGSTWMTDPQAQRYADDGFGNRNAVLAVAAPTI